MSRRRLLPMQMRDLAWPRQDVTHRSKTSASNGIRTNKRPLETLIFPSLGVKSLADKAKYCLFTSKQSTWWNSVTSRCMDMAQCSEWVTKPAWMTKIPIPKSRKSVQKRFKGKSRSIEAKFAFLRRHFFADFLSKRRFSECRWWWWSWQSSHQHLSPVWWY